MSPEVKSFIENNTEFINNGEYRELYCKAFGELKYPQILELEDNISTVGVTQGKLFKYFPLHFLILKGASNTGKTYTLKRLIQLLLEDPSFKLFDCCDNFYKKLNSYVCNSRGDMPDVWAKFCYKGTHIVITTKGDSPTDVVSDFERHKLGCDIFVCACHDTAKAKDALKKYLGVTDDEFISKAVVSNKSNQESWMQTNDTQAMDLLNKIKSLI